jgi:hypothetical protein
LVRSLRRCQVQQHSDYQCGHGTAEDQDQPSAGACKWILHVFDTTGQKDQSQGSSSNYYLDPGDEELELLVQLLPYYTGSTEPETNDHR